MAFSMNKLTVVLIVAVVVIGGSAAAIMLVNNDRNSDSVDTTLTVGTTTTITGTNFSAANYRYMIQDIMYLPLINWNYGTAYPCLAESWTHDDDFKVYTVNLRDDVYWSDGEKFDADDVVISIQNKMASSLSGYSDVEKITDYQVKITMGLVDTSDPSKGVAGNANWPAENTNLQIFPSHIFSSEQLGSFGACAYPEYCVATGPMVIDSNDGINMDAGTITYVANESYFGGTPAVKKLVMKCYSNIDAMMMALLKGEVDTIYDYTNMGMNMNYLSKVVSDQDLSLKSVDSAALGPSLWFNQDTAVGADKDVRIACRYAMNYEEVISYLAAGVGEIPNTGVWTPRGAFYKETAQMEYSPEKARQTLDDAGWTIKGTDTYRTDANGNILQIDLQTRVTDVQCVKAMDFIAGYLEDVGIKTTQTIAQSSEFMSNISSDQYEVTVFYWTAGAMDSRYGFLTAPLYASKMMGNDIGSDETVIDLVNTLRSTAVEEREAIAGQIQDYWAENAPMIPLYWYSFLIPYNSDITGLCDHSTYGIICVDTMMNLHKTN